MVQKFSSALLLTTDFNDACGSCNANSVMGRFKGGVRGGSFVRIHEN